MGNCHLIKPVSISTAVISPIELLKTIKSSTITNENLISEIVNDLSTHARDARTTGNSSINLNDIADKSMEISKHTRNLSSIEIVKQYTNEAVVIGSSSELTQVITNFVNNAVDAMNDEGKLWLITKKSNDKCSISVKDNGSGMDEATQKKIFDPFFTTKEPGKGTGLGLHVVRKIIEKHDAELELESNLGEGTTFTIIFPTAKNNSN